MQCSCLQHSLLSWAQFITGPDFELICSIGIQSIHIYLSLKHQNVSCDFQSVLCTAYIKTLKRLRDCKGSELYGNRSAPFEGNLWAKFPPVVPEAQGHPLVLTFISGISWLLRMGMKLKTVLTIIPTVSNSFYTLYKCYILRTVT